MKRLHIYPLLLLVLSSFISADKAKLPSKDFLNLGEKLEFRVHYGFMNAGDAVIQVHPDLYIINNKVCYKATCFGRSVGAFELVTKIRDTWGSYIDTTELLPQRAYRDIAEGRHKLKEGVYFYHNKGIANTEREKRGKTTNYTNNVPFGVQDMVSGLFFLRKLDYSKIKVGDFITVTAFVEEELFELKVQYIGKENIKTKFGSINAIKLMPIMPENKLFAGENPIRLWLSDDKNKIPVKIQAELVVGAVEIDLKSYQGLKNPINFKND